MNLLSAIASCVPEKTKGLIDYYRFPERRNSWGGPFNGQKARTDIFLALMHRLSPVAIVETGTYLGTTTEFLAEFDRPVYTVEGQPRTYGFAKTRLRKLRNVNLLLGDSRSILRQLFDGPLHLLAGHTLIFYLDAHWNADLPLAEELDIVFSQCPGAVVMVDDFQVPGDSGYSFDDYGPCKSLTKDYIRPAVMAYGLEEFYPAKPAAEESGARRGCVVLVRGDIHGAAVATLPLLRVTAEISAPRAV